MSRTSFRFDPAKVIRNMAEIKQRSMFAAEKVAENAAARMEAEAKRNAPWTDRTGNARQTIKGFHGWSGRKLHCGVSGNMEYSGYLEYANEGKNAVLWPTVRANEAKIKEQFRKVVR